MTEQLISLTDVQDGMRSCTACSLSNDRTKVVVGEGPIDAKLVILGEAPGEAEDVMGLPFQGAAGRLLNDLLREVGIRRQHVFVTNAVRCRPTKSVNGFIRNDKPKKASIVACTDHLLAELACIDPTVIVVMGETALISLMGLSGITKYRGSVLTASLDTVSGTRDVKVIPTFHPAYALYDARQRPIIASDLRRAAEELSTLEHTPDQKTKWNEIRTLDGLHELVDYLIAQPVFAFDTETSGPYKDGGLDPRFFETLCLSFSCVEGEGWVVPIRGQLPKDKWDTKTGYYNTDDLPWEWSETEYMSVVIPELQRLFASDTPKVAQNGKFDRHVLAKMGIDVREFVFDTILAHAVIDENQPHNLEHLRTQYTNLDRYEGFKDALPRDDAPYSLVDPAELRAYAAADTDVTLRVFPHLMKGLDQEGAQAWWVLENMMMPLSDSLFTMERNGMLVSEERLWQLQTQYTTWICEEEERLFENVGRRFLYSSPLQLSRLLFTERGLEPLKLTASGGFSTDAETLGELHVIYPDDPALSSIMNLRKLIRMRDTYLAGKDGHGGLLRWVDNDWRIHSRFNVGKVVTGRLSSEAPNLHNIPKKDAEDIDVAELDLAVRTLFVAPPGYYLVESDYSQLELRLQAYICQEQVLLDAFKTGKVDQHKLTASLVYGIPQSDVTKNQRTEAKKVNFTVGYGGGIPAITRVTKWDRDRADAFLQKMKKGYPATEKKRRMAVRELERNGFVQNRFGRRRHFPAYPQVMRVATITRDQRERSLARQHAARMERQAYNFWIQSTGSDILTLATINAVLRNDVLRRIGVIPVLTLHDALYFYVPIPAIDEAIPEIRRVMEGVTKEYAILFPSMADWELPVDISWGTSWGKPIGESHGVVH